MKRLTIIMSRSHTSVPNGLSRNVSLSFPAQFILCFLFVFLLCWLFPYTGDDWTWGTQVGIDRLNSWFDNYSGRYLGNLIILTLTRSKFLKTFAMAFCYTGIAALIEKITQFQYAFLLSGLFLLLTPKKLAAQTIVWTSGFANYCTSIALSLVYFVTFYWIFQKKSEIDQNNLRQKPIMAVLLLLLGCANTLIVEHITIFNVILSIFVIGFIFVKFRKILIQYVAYAMGAFAGTTCMFSNSVYHSVVTGEDFYRSITFSPTRIVLQAVENYFDVIYREFYMQNIWVNLAIFVICFLHIKQMKECLSRKVSCIAVFCLWINGVYVLWSFVSVISVSKDVKPESYKYVEGVATIVAGAALITLLCVISLYKKQLPKMLFLIGCILFIVASLFIVTPVSTRCFFATYILFVVLLNSICGMLSYKVIDAKKISRILQWISVLLLVFYFGIFGSIYAVDQQRMDYVQDQIQAGETKIEVIRHPYESYLYFTTPINSNFWKNAFKDFNDIPRDVELVFVTEYNNPTE